MATASQADVLDQIFAGLKSKVHETRLASAVELQRYVRTDHIMHTLLSLIVECFAQVSNAVPEMASDAAAKQWDETINRRLFDLVHSQANYEKLGGILAIGECSVALLWNQHFLSAVLRTVS